MRVGVLARPRDPFSLAAYRDHLLRELPVHDVQCVPVPLHGSLPPGLDLLWDPGLGMRGVPALLRRTALPVVATVHGLLAFALPRRETVRGVPALARQTLRALAVRTGWRALRRSVRRVIAVSPYGAAEARRVLRLADGVVRPILHGVDHATFRPDGPRAQRERPYLLMVAQYQPKKNVDRVLAAHAQLPADLRPDLVAILPGYPPQRAEPAGVTVLRTAQAPTDLAAWYRGALALIAPSLHETFGMPLAEAMACGCPVVTSDVTACPEVTAGAALLVDPRSTSAIRAAMTRVAADATLRRELADLGLARAARLTWRDSAARHAQVFAEALGGGG